jgi:hypothetical protein
MINEIELNPPEIKYPNRTATFLRNTHYMSRFDGDLGFIDLEDQESKMAKERQLQEDARNAAKETKGTHLEVQANSGRTTPLIASSLPSDYDSIPDITEIDRAEQSRRFVQAAKDYRMKKRSAKGLRDISDLMTSDFDFQSMPNSARGSAEEIMSRAEPLVERASASTSAQNYAFGINPIPLPTEPEEKKRLKYIPKQPPQKIK